MRNQGPVIAGVCLPRTLRNSSPLFPWLARAAAAVILVWLLLTGIILAIRSTLHATQPLPPWQLAVASFALVIAARLVHAAGRFTASEIRPAIYSLPILFAVATTVAIVLWGLSLSRGVESPAALAFCWLLFVGEETWAWRQMVHRRRPWSHSRGTSAAVKNDRVLQQFTRLLTTDGAEIIRGSLSVTVERGCKHAAGHVAFCPPFAQRPHFDVQPGSATNATLKVSQLFSHGARIEVRLPQAATSDAAVSIDFAARASHSVAEPE